MSAEIADFENSPAAVFEQHPRAALRAGPQSALEWMPGEIVDVADVTGVGECGWAWGRSSSTSTTTACRPPVTNGYISASRTRDYWYESGFMGSASKAVMEDARHWPPMKDASLAGYEKKCVFRNEGWRFVDVAGRTGWADDRSDGRGLAAIDYRNDGSLSFIEANEGQPLRFYRNEQLNANRWIGFRLTGTRSNRDAFGARVEVRLADRTLSRELEPANGFMAQSDGRIHFGLGLEPELREVVIRWPSGEVQRLRNPRLDRYHAVKEPGRRGAGR